MRRFSWPIATLLTVSSISMHAAAEPARLDDGAVTYTVTHRFKTFEGIVPAADLDASLSYDARAPEDLSFQVTIPLGAFDSGNQLRDQHAAEALELFEFPQAVWTVDAVKVVSTMAQDDGTIDSELAVSGPLTLHGVTRTLQTKVTLNHDPDTDSGQALRVWDTFNLNLSDHDIERPGLLGIKVEDAVPVAVELSFTWPSS